MEARLASEVQISALKRLAQAEGDFATVLKRGDAISGAILLIGQVRGANPIIYERYPSLDGQSAWKSVDLTNSSDPIVQDYWKKRAMRDPDLWVLELDVASGARLDGLLAALN
ncbi:MAG: hypothetical protein B7Y00_08055 [Sphingomonadales bacterium 17-56-6]|nr:MAG: hypothetical protein B7Y44_09700 [Sphingomonadales bacterium 28-55-16]OYZ85387.1 MAG: hypothetical protein B7Y00_08055 [Sphingomonadales bacterium 17-56-6]